MNTYLYHHGIMGQKWGVRNGPPYPLKGGMYYKDASYFEKYREENRENSESNKKHFDKEIAKGTEVQTLSYNPNRTKKAQYYYAAYDKWDKRHYEGYFNQRSKDTKKLKFRITNTARKNIKVASEDSSVKAFAKLFSTNRDFYNYVTDPKRMQSNFSKDYLAIKGLSHKGYNEAFKSLEKARSQKSVSYDDIKKIYRLYNYTLPSEGRDSAAQRTKFIKELKDSGYDAILDTNDALYNSVKASAPVIIINPRALISKDVEQTKLTDKTFGALSTIGRKVIRR